MTSPLPAAIAERLESAGFLDAPAKAIAKQVRSLIPAGPVKDALSGVPIGHALHPLLTDVPIGTWTSATVLDLVGGADSDTAARRLIGTGLLATAPTVVSGWSDWADAEPADAGVRRAGLAHAACNVGAVALMLGSLAARRAGATGRGKLLSLTGMGLLGAGGWIGGHLSYAQGVGVDTTVFDPGPDEWTATGVRSDALTEDAPRCVLVGEVPVLLVRHQGALRALHNRCSHRAGSLADGDVAGGTVTCPLHGSVFALDDGSVRRGPSAYPQPAFDVREVTDGEVEVRRRVPAA
jgi:nitrite reductase/ring-hydroxylating ferredoxin subunit/uncharacterized membrane protein